jgi:hypothetical protein
VKTKTYRGKLEFKQAVEGDGDSGAFTSVFATLSVIDHDGDVTLPGAFGEQEVLVEPWNHNWQAPPVGSATIRERGDQAVAEGEFFLETEAGRDHHAVARRLAPRGEWSYSFNIVEAEKGELEGQKVQFLKKLDVVGVGQVTRGAGIDTHTESVKHAKRALPTHETPTTDAAWDGPANEARARSGEDEAYYKRIYAWRDPDSDSGVKSSYRFIHHTVGSDGTPGAANIRGCQTGIGVLNGGRGGTTIPDADRQGVYNHLARHLRDAEVEPPELKSAGAGDDGQAGAGDGEPSGPAPGVAAAQIEILILEDN